MARNKHSEKIVDWEAALDFIDFKPRQPSFTAGFKLSSLAVFVMDHRKRRLPTSSRSLEAHYGSFVIDQKRWPSVEEARRRALATPYGRDAATVHIGGNEGRSYALGPEVEPDDIDGRSPAVVVWHEDNIVYLVASSQLESGTLLRIASSMY